MIQISNPVYEKQFQRKMLTRHSGMSILFPTCANIGLIAQKFTWTISKILNEDVEGLRLSEFYISNQIEASNGMNYNKVSNCA